MKELTIPAVNEKLDEVQDFVRVFLQEAGFQSKQIMQVNIAVEEIYINIASYAYRPEIGLATIRCINNVDRAVVEFMDSGKRYNPLERPEPDISKALTERDIGGLGVFMVKKLMDNISYRYENGKNILIIEKKIKLEANMDIKKIVTENELELSLSGRLDANTAVALEKEIGELQNVDVLVLNLKDLQYISSAGLRVILMAHKKMRAVAGSMKVVHPTEVVMEVFVMTGFTDILTIEQ